MSWLILKVDKDPGSDRYCIWSVTAGAPVFDGTKAVLARYWEACNAPDLSLDLGAKFERADRAGSSSLYGGDWDGRGLDYQGLGILIRESLGPMLDRMNALTTGWGFTSEMARHYLRPYEES
jgi:hypothetical protein